jgi:hypothetical protein
VLLVHALLLAHVGASLLLLLCFAAVVAGQRLRRSTASANATPAAPADACPADPVPVQPVREPALSSSAA